MVMTKNMYKEIFEDLVTKPFKKSEWSNSTML
jgi:hypothetical protein